MFRTLRGRLLALFFLVALIPSLGLTYAVTQYLARSLSSLRNPETERALGQSLDLIRQGIERLGSDARHHAEVMALDAETVRLMQAADITAVERFLREEARDRGLDFVCVYDIGSEAEARLFGARLGPRITLPSPDRAALLAARDAGGLVSGSDVPRQVSGVAALGERHVVLAGYQLDPEVSSEIEALQKNLTMYRRLGIYTSLSQRGVWLFGILWTLVLALLSFALAVIISRSIAGPVLELRSGMERLTQGDLEHRVAPRGTSEVRFLGRAFNRMVEEIQTSRRALLQAERLAAWREVARAVAHEIRNPLTPIQFALQRLQEEAKRAEGPRPDVVSESSEAILREVRSLQEFATAFSSVAQLPDPKLQKCEVDALVEDVARLYRGSTPVEFRVECEAPLPVAWADPGQIQRVLVNLIKNALEALDGRGAIELRVRRDGADGGLLLEVADNGPGMDPGTLERAGHPGFTTKSSGSGLGLTLVQRIVEQHGGRFALASNPGGGTRATFTLPEAPPDAAAHTEPKP
jgi:nitrogen fixation/metabolism regulation signal transduction histidine kinase